MVIQRDTLIRVWGWYEPGGVVQVSGSWDPTNVSQVTCNAKGKFVARLATPPAGGPHTLTVTSGAQTIEIEDVLSGEVWLCAGQSNMDWHMKWTAEGQAEIPQANHSKIRLFTIGEVYDISPQEDAVGHWRPCESATVAEFSAVAYFFGKELFNSLEGIPIGLVNASVGGSVIESWTSEASLRLEHDFDSDLNHLQQLREGLIEEDLSLRQELWWSVLAQQEIGQAARWFQGDHDATAWPRIPVPMDFDQVGASLYDGTLWLQRKFELPVGWDTVDLSLAIGAIDDMDLTYVNGIEVGHTRLTGNWNQDRSYTIPSNLLQPGENTITVMVLDTGGAGCFGGTGTHPAGVVLERVDGLDRPIGINGPWSYHLGTPLAELPTFPTEGWLTLNTPSVLYNGMIAPLANMKLAGVIWYQGEANVRRAQQYRRLMHRWIQDWRDTFHQEDLPVLWAQIAPFSMPGDEGQFAELREAQALALTNRWTGMVVTMDIGDPNNIHPDGKDVVGHRFARFARREVYEQTVEANGPTYLESAIEGRKMRLFFRDATGLRADAAATQAFTVAGADQVFHQATIEISGSSVLVWANQIPHPVAVRFAWGAGDVVGLVNDAELPASSFRTDDWPMVTAED
tara:strand:+ start:3603 stop:5480 length:1878 start_codon:yes stop_codon:yes gene_type:complete